MLLVELHRRVCVLCAVLTRTARTQSRGVGVRTLSAVLRRRSRVRAMAAEHRGRLVRAKGEGMRLVSSSFPNASPC